MPQTPHAWGECQTIAPPERRHKEPGIIVHLQQHTELQHEKEYEYDVCNVYQHISEVIGHWVELGKVVVDGQREHAEGVIVVFLVSILGEDDLEVFRGKGFDIGVIGDVIIIIPIGKLVVQGVPETNKSKHTDGAEYQYFFM